MHVSSVELVLSVGVPVLLTLVTLFFPRVAMAAAVYGLVLAIVEPVVFDQFRRRFQREGAKLQEQFDCAVLHLPRHEPLTGRDPDPEDVREAARVYRRRPNADQLLRDWYAPAVAGLPLGAARAVCQRINCRWDVAARRRYRGGLAGSGILLVVLALAWNALADRTTLQLVLSFAALAPVVKWLLAEWIRHGESIRTNEELKSRADDLWRRALERKISDSALGRESRDLQDAIFLRRQSDPTIFHWLHDRLRPRFERQMHETVEHMVKSYSTATATHERR
jgi:hypothetical protein